MKVLVDDKLFIKQMNNLVQYGYGFIDGVQAGKGDLLLQLAPDIKRLAEEYIDANARANPGSLHHVYEWYQVGSPGGRLFDIDYTLVGNGLSFQSSFSQSTSIKNGSKTPFYDKARIMEQGMPVKITPKNADVLAFEVDGKTVFTRGPVTVDRPGGNSAGSYEETFKEFFLRYLSQSFMSVTGLNTFFNNPVAFKRNFAAGVAGGRSVGVRTGKNWMSSKKGVF